MFHFPQFVVRWNIQFAHILLKTKKNKCDIGIGIVTTVSIRL